MSYRVEVRLTGDAWDQPIAVLHPSEHFAVRVGQAVRKEFGRPVRVTRADPPDGAPAGWAEGQVVWES